MARIQAIAYTELGASITRRSVVRIRSPLLFSRRPEMVVFGLNMRFAPLFDCFNLRSEFFGFAITLLFLVLSISVLVQE